MKSDEWRVLGSVCFNPSQTFPWFSIGWYYGEKYPLGKDEALYFENIRNLKSVYAVNDPENLYLMLEFYGSPPSQGVGSWDGPFIAMDMSGELSHQEGEELWLFLDHREEIAG